MSQRLVVLPFLSSAAAALTVLAVWWAVEHQEEQAIRRQTALAARDAARRLEDFVESRLHVVEAIRRERQEGFLADRESFVRRVRIIQEELGGFLGIHWIDSGGVIRWLSPVEGNEAALGRTVTENPVAATSFQRAREDGVWAVTAPMDLFQGKRGIVSYHPVIVDGQLLGFVNGVFRVSDLVEQCLEPGLLEGHEVTLYDGQALLYGDPHAPSSDRATVAASTLDVAGRRWDLRVTPRAALYDELSSRTDEVLLGLGLLLSIGLGVLLRLSLHRQADRKAVERERAQLATLVEASVDAIGIAHPNGRLFYFNQAARELVGVDPADDLSTASIADFLDPRDQLRAAQIWGDLHRDGFWEGRLRYRPRGSDEGIDMELRAFVLRDPETGRIAAIAASGRDVRDRMRLEADLRHAQKMEAVGRLAGGIAHDFNNLLTAVLGHADIARMRCGDDARITDSLDEIGKAARRASELTSKLLAFSRKQVVEPRPISLAEQIEDMRGMLDRLVPENITLRVEIGGPLPAIVADPSQIGQVLMNLVINGVDAMLDGGELLVEAWAEEGWVHLRVSDSGIGMSEEVCERIFDPFFTTKDRGRGTGLGLATVYGIVTGAGGTIAVESAPGRGSTFAVRFPASGEPPVRQTAAEPESATETRGGSESILLVEDDRQVRQVAARTLREAGYEVVEAEDGRQALEWMEREGRSPDLLVSDVVMPGMSGLELVRRVRGSHPAIPVVLCSGHSDERIDLEELQSLGTTFLAKPYTTTELLRTVRQTLDVRTGLCV